MTTIDYQAFLAAKHLSVPAAGIRVLPSALPETLFEHQRRVAQWALERGRAALFLDTGLGKTGCQLAWADRIHWHTNRPVLILAPLAVAQQTAREARRFDLHVTVCREQADVQPGINIANYEMLSHFTPRAFAGVVLDESSILKAFMGKTKRTLVEQFADTPYKLCCTATPAPNDVLELGNHADFLGIMPSNEMIARWFINDTMNFGRYRLKGHAAPDFYRWLASWAVSMQKPSDIGCSDAGYDLPPLNLHQLTVRVDQTAEAGEGRLIRDVSLNATTLHKEMRLTAPDRADAVAELVNADTECWVVWCNTNYEADALMQRIPGAVEVRGSHSLKLKEQRLEAFAAGEIRVLVTKPSICGYGLNWQHCHKTAFCGLSYSFEDLYQALRRLYRFGQQHPVDAYLVVAETEGNILHTVQAKMAAHEELQRGLISAAQLNSDQQRQLSDVGGDRVIAFPEWLKAA